MTSIVVADDELDILESTELVLSMEGFKVTIVQDAREILPTLRRVKPDIFLQDINMPGSDPAANIKAIRADPKLKGVRVLVFTASVDSEGICEQLKADGFIQKPFDARRIKEDINKVLRPKAGK